MTKYPDRSNVVYTKEQIEFRKIVREAAKFASEIVSDPVKKSTYPPPGPEIHLPLCTLRFHERI